MKEGATTNNWGIGQNRNQKKKPQHEERIKPYVQMSEENERRRTRRREKKYNFSTKQPFGVSQEKKRTQINAQLHKEMDTLVVCVLKDDDETAVR